MVDIFQFNHETAESIAKANSEQGIFAQPTFRMVIDLKGFQHKGQRNNVDPYGEIVIEFASEADFINKLWVLVEPKIKRQVIFTPDNEVPFTWGPNAEERTEADM